MNTDREQMAAKAREKHEKKRGAKKPGVVEIVKDVVTDAALAVGKAAKKVKDAVVPPKTT